MKYKPLIGDQMSGSVGGVTASHNRGGTYFRQRAIPVNPATPFQLIIRQLMSDLTSRWNNILTAAQRTAWDLYASLTQLPDVLGEPRNVGGIGMYLRTNIPAGQSALTFIDDAPTIFNLGEFTDPNLASVTAPATASVSFTTTDEWVNEDNSRMLIYFSTGRNLSTNFFKGPYNYAGAIIGNGTTPPTSPASLTLVKPVSAGQRVFMKANVLRADGRRSSDFRDFVTSV